MILSLVSIILPPKLASVILALVVFYMSVIEYLYSIAVETAEDDEAKPDELSNSETESDQ